MSNARLSVARHGSQVVSVSRIVYGVTVMPGGEGVVRRNRVFYTKLVTSDSFSIVANFASHREYERVAKWLVEYGESVGDPDTGADPMRVEVPSMNFDRLGVVTSGITFGDVIGRIVHTMTLAFEGVRDPVSAIGNRISRYRLPRVIVGTGGGGRYFTPNDIEVQVGQTAEERIYGMSSDEVANKAAKGTWQPVHPIPPNVR